MINGLFKQKKKLFKMKTGVIGYYLLIINIGGSIIDRCKLEDAE